jgi:hypothetical protein
LEPIKRPSDPLFDFAGGALLVQLAHQQRKQRNNTMPHAARRCTRHPRLFLRILKNGSKPRNAGISTLFPLFVAVQSAKKWQLASAKQAHNDPSGKCQVASTTSVLCCQVPSRNIATLRCNIDTHWRPQSVIGVQKGTGKRNHPTRPQDRIGSWRFHRIRELDKL